MSSASDDFWDRPLAPEEFRSRVAKAIAELETAEGVVMREYLDWFCRKYPTGADRLAYIRRKMAELSR